MATGRMERTKAHTEVGSTKTYPDQERKHHTRVFTSAGDARLGADIMQLRYDRTVLVLEGMMAEAERQQLGDLERGRPKLSGALRRLRDALRVATEEAREIRDICAPFNAKG